MFLSSGNFVICRMSSPQDFNDAKSVSKFLSKAGNLFTPNNLTDLEGSCVCRTCPFRFRDIGVLDALLEVEHWDNIRLPFCYGLDSSHLHEPLRLLSVLTHNEPLAFERRDGSTITLSAAWNDGNWAVIPKRFCNFVPKKSK